MNWYKSAFKLEDMADRNRLNQRVRTFQSLVVRLSRLIKYVYQNAPEVKRQLEAMEKHPELESFDKIRELLQNAISKVLDSYQWSAFYMQQAMDELYSEVKSMEKERDEFTSDFLPKEMQKVRRRQ